MGKTGRIELGAEPLYDICRSLADRGEDYGWNAYYSGNSIPPATVQKLTASDPSFTHWHEAFRASLKAYREASGKAFHY